MPLEALGKRGPNLRRLGLAPLEHYGDIELHDVVVPRARHRMVEASRVSDPRSDPDVGRQLEVQPRTDPHREHVPGRAWLVVLDREGRVEPSLVT